MVEKKEIQWVYKDPTNPTYYWPTEKLKENAWLNDPKIYEEASKDPIKWWSKIAKECISWYKDWTCPHKTEESGQIKWFCGGKLNVSYNIIDRNLKERKDKVAIYWEPEDVTIAKPLAITYGELSEKVNKFANVLKSFGIGKGDRVCIYLPMIPEALISMIACTRIGAVHATIFSAFSKQSLNDRLKRGNVKLLVTADGYYRRGKPICLKDVADSSIEGTLVEHIIVVKRSNLKPIMKPSRDFWWDEIMEKSPAYCEPEHMDSEDPLFILYTSGTTGKPKGIIHHTGGYAVGACYTSKINFNLHEDDVYFCTADIGWITGHTYNCYGPLLNGATMILYEGAPDYPDYSRWWSIIEHYKATVFYTSPTAIRMLKKFGSVYIKKHVLTSLRILASVGEPINDTAWMWFFEQIGGGRCPIIDTWWQTETGSIMINNLPGIGPFIPGVAGRPFPGVVAEVVSDQIAPIDLQEPGLLFLKSPFPPSLFRDIQKDDSIEAKKYSEQFRVLGGERKYFSNDGAIIYDKMGNIKLTGRLDDIMKVSGHAIATAELESALTKHPQVAEAAVVSLPNEIKFEVPLAFIILKEGIKPEPGLEASLKKKVDELIGAIARPDKIVVVDDLPKTRSGKILRRMLKNLVRMKPIGDITSLTNPDSIQKIRAIMGLPKSPFKPAVEGDKTAISKAAQFSLDGPKKTI